MSLENAGVPPEQVLVFKGRASPRQRAVLKFLTRDSQLCATLDAMTGLSVEIVHEGPSLQS